MTSLERAQSARFWLQKSTLDYLKSSFTFTDGPHVIMAWLVWAFLATGLLNLLMRWLTWPPNVIFAGCFILPLILMVVGPIGMILHRGVLWRQSTQNASIDWPKSALFHRDHIEGEMSLHAKIAGSAHLETMPRWVRSVVVERGYVWYLR